MHGGQVTDKIAAIEKALEEMRYARDDSTCPEHAAYHLLKEYIGELRAQTPAEKNRVLFAMTHQVNVARRQKVTQGFYDTGTAMTICESICGRWWPVVRAALEQANAPAL